MDANVPNVQTPTRPRDPLNAPPSKEARTSRDTDEPPAEVNLREYGLPFWEDSAISLDVAQDDRAQAICHPLLGWPDFARLFGDTGGRTWPIQFSMRRHTANCPGKPRVPGARTLTPRPLTRPKLAPRM